MYDSTFTMRRRVTLMNERQKMKNGDFGEKGLLPGKRKKSDPKPSAGDTGGDVNCSSDTYNCSDFDTYQESLRVLKACSGDGHELDGNGDGVPCESLK